MPTNQFNSCRVCTVQCAVCSVQCALCTVAVINKYFLTDDILQRKLPRVKKIEIDKPEIRQTDTKIDQKSDKQTLR